jgi:SOS-response transcriptional repressor LexA
MTYSVFHIRIPLLGIIEAGWPSPAEEELSDTIDLDEWLMAENREAKSLLPVQTNAMKGAGLIGGDVVIFDRSRTPKDGDIVLAEVDDVVALRYFRKRGSRVYLEAAHRNYNPLVPTEKLTVIAVVTAVIRKYY